jgi:2-polyprenyl-3-methyl-5-hydroxy-6-metoxy-1,4-benzoquinol methylase
VNITDEQKVRELYSHLKWFRRYYQDIPELGLNRSERKNAQRVIDLQLDRIDFQDKIVWDVGCAGGFFLRYAIDRGAKRAIGFDRLNIVTVVSQVNALLGYGQIELHGVDLDDYDFSDVPDPDIVFFLSMNYHVGVPEAIQKRAQMVIFEDNGKKSRGIPGKIGRSFTDNFEHIEYIGRSSDWEPTTIYHLMKKSDGFCRSGSDSGSV